MRRLTTLFTLLVAATPAMAQPYPDQPYPYEPAVGVDLDASIYADVNVAPIGEEVPDVTVFYDRLAPYGSWRDDPIYGYVFVPADTGYVPYSNGYWKLTDFGWTWIAADPHGWATSHYGRWVWRDRWVWRPDTTWGPAWVQWRESDHVVGWAPLGYDVDAYVPETNWRFIPTVYITSTDVSRYYVRADVARYVRDTRPIVRWNRYHDRRWVAGPDRAYLERHKVKVQRVAYQPREVGRFDAAERRQLDQRAAEAKVKYRARVTRDAQIRTQLETKRATVERTQVEQQRQRARQQPQPSKTQVEAQQRQTEQRQRAEQAKQVQQRQTEQRQRAEQAKQVQQRQNEQRQRAEQAKQVQQRQTEQRQRTEQTKQVQQRQTEQRQRAEQAKQRQSELVDKQKSDQREQQQRARQQVEERKLQDKQHEQNERRQLETKKQPAEQRRAQPQQKPRVEPQRSEPQKARPEERRRGPETDRKK